jgi:hypothetical protein
MTHLIGLAHLPILRRLFQRSRVKQLLLNTIQRWQFGTDDFVVTTLVGGATGTSTKLISDTFGFGSFGF